MKRVILALLVTSSLSADLISDQQSLIISQQNIIIEQQAQQIKDDRRRRLLNAIGDTFNPTKPNVVIINNTPSQYTPINYSIRPLF